MLSLTAMGTRITVNRLFDFDCKNFHWCSKFSMEAKDIQAGSSGAAFWDFNNWIIIQKIHLVLIRNETFSNLLLTNLSMTWFVD